MAGRAAPETDEGYERPKDWQEHEAKLLNYVEGSIQWHRFKSAWWQRMSNRVSFLLVMLSAVTPVLVTISVKSDQRSVDLTFIFWLSIFCSLSIAIIEGLRRTFRLEDHWRQTHIVMETLLSQRKAYVANQFGLTPGTSDWIKNYRNYDRAFEGLLNEFTNHLLRRPGDEMSGRRDEQPEHPSAAASPAS